MNEDSNVIDLSKAERYFRNGARYAKAEIASLSEAKKFCGEAYFHASVACYVQADEYRQSGKKSEAERLLREAVNLAKRATEIYPELTESFYQHAKTCVLTGDKQGAIQSVEIAIKADRNYCLKADVDKDFDRIRPNIFQMLEILRQQAKEEAQEALNKAYQLFDNYVFLTSKAQQTKEEVEKLLRKGKNLFQSGRTYFDYLDVIEYPEQVKEIITAVLYLPTRSLAILSGRGRSVSFSPDGQYLASGPGCKSGPDAYYSTLQLWNISSKEEVTLRIPEDKNEGSGGKFSVTFSPDGKYIAASEFSAHTVLLWEGAVVLGRREIIKYQ